MAKTDTLILTFGQSVMTEHGLLLVELDPLKHPDENGGSINRFQVGIKEIFFLVHHDPKISIVKVRETDFGGIFKVGQVTRTGKVEQVTFTHPAMECSLPHIPSGRPSCSPWYGRQSGIDWIGGNTIKAPGAPCLGDITYPYTATQYRYALPAKSLAIGEEYPIDLVVEYARAT